MYRKEKPSREPKRVGAGNRGMPSGVINRIGAGVPHISAMWNNEIGKSSIAFLVPLTDEIEDWVLNVSKNQEDGYVRSFRAVYEDEDRTAQLVMSGEGEVYPHIFGRNGIAVVFVVNIADFKRKAIEL